MALARFKDLCIDANDPDRIGRFWATVLDRQWDGHDAIHGPTSQHTVWVNQVPEPRTVKHRVHLDVYCTTLDELTARGATVVEAHDDWPWSVMADPEGGEFCAFRRGAAELPRERNHGLVVDCADPESQAEWWAGVYGARVVHHASGYSTVEHIEGMPILTMDFCPVPEPKTVKNRVHWDVTVARDEGLDGLTGAGATLLRHQDDEIRWHVLADPEGNEFCAFESA